MLRFKVFDSAECADDMVHYENAVDSWLRLEQPRIRFMAQSTRGDHLVLSFIYEPGDIANDGERVRAPSPTYQGDADDDEFDGDEVDDAGLPEAELPY